MARMRERLLILRLLEIHPPVTTIDMVVTGQIEDMEVITTDLVTGITITVFQIIGMEIITVGFQIGDINHPKYLIFPGLGSKAIPSSRSF